MTGGKPDTYPCDYCGKAVAQQPGPGRLKRACTTWHSRAYRLRWSEYLRPDGH